VTGASSPASPGRRVAFVAEELHSSGGLELFELAIAESLARRGWQLELSYRLDGDLLNAGRPSRPCTGEARVARPPMTRAPSTPPSSPPWSQGRTSSTATGCT